MTVGKQIILGPNDSWTPWITEDVTQLPTGNQGQNSAKKNGCSHSETEEITLFRFTGTYCKQCGEQVKESK